MNMLRNQKGISLITALMLTLISLVIVSALFYLITSNTQASGSHKRYKTALEAAYGSVDVAFSDVVPLVLQGYPTSQIRDELLSELSPSFGSGSECLKQKLDKAPAEWPAECSGTMDPKTGYDMGFSLKAAKASVGEYQVYTKIVDTRPGNTDRSGRQLEGFGVVESNITTPPHTPYMYRLEVQAESAGSTKERARLSVVYGY